MDTMTKSESVSAGQSPIKMLVCALQLEGRGDIFGGHEIFKRVEEVMANAQVTFTVLKPRFGPLESSLFNRD
jgi:hypothetical protein